MQAPPSSHFIYIPVVVILGIVLGFILGAKATRDAIALEARKLADREARRMAREAKRAQASADQTTGTTEPPTS